MAPGETTDQNLIVHEREPFNAGPPLERLCGELLTPTGTFYVRNHAPVPDVDPDTYRLRVDGLVEDPLEVSLTDLAGRFPRVEVVATLACAGNRRRELMEVADIPGETPWGPHAVGTAVWSGWRLSDVLDTARPAGEVGHIAFAGLDRIDHGGGDPEAFGASLPLDKARSPEVLLADRMNGRPLTPAHGFPLRVVVPGYIGARSVKWLDRIQARATPSGNHYQRSAYRLQPAGATGATGPHRRGFALGELPVNSAICQPVDGSRIAGPVHLAGYALSGGRPVQRVDLTADHGGTWWPAHRLRSAGRWGWSLWEGELDLPPGRHEIAVRAVDSAANTQPERPTDVWNPKGYVNNSWHRIRVVVG